MALRLPRRPFGRPAALIRKPHLNVGTPKPPIAAESKRGEPARSGKPGLNSFTFTNLLTGTPRMSLSFQTHNAPGAN
jgi:hypothetical protein